MQRAIAGCLLTVVVGMAGLRSPMLAQGAAKPVRITILGDSIDADEPAERPIQGWGTFLQSKLSNAAVTNLALSGRSTKTYMHGDHLPDGRFVEPKRWMAALQTPADYWVIKFGGNDSHPATEEKHTEPAEYAANLKIMVSEARKRGIKPILVTPFRRPFGKDGKLGTELDSYADAARSVATEENVPLIDMYAYATEWFTSLGPAGLQAYVPKELGGHMNRAGAESMAGWMAQQLVKVIPQLSLVASAK